MVNNVIAVVNNVIAARPSPLKFVIADISQAGRARALLLANRLGVQRSPPSGTGAPTGFGAGTSVAHASAIG
jgi:hypothetical protein